MAKLKTRSFEPNQPNTPKNDKEEVRRWQDRVTVALRSRDRISQDNRWEEFIKEYEGQYRVQLGGMLVPPVNEVFAFIQSSIAGLYFKDPYIAVNPKKTGSIKGAKILESAVNYYWRELDTKPEIESEIIDCGLVGHGWHKTGFKATFEGTGMDMRVVSEDIVSSRVSWRDVVFNIAARNPPNDCQWIAQRIIMPTMDAREKFNAPLLKGGKLPSITDQEYQQAVYKDDLEFSVLWEIHDARDKKIRLIAEGYESYLKVSAWPDYLDSFAFDMLYYNKINDKAYPMSDIAPWEPQILEEIKLLAMALNHVKRWNRQLLVKKGAIDQKNMDKFELAVDGSIVEVKGDPAAATMPTQYAALPPDIYTLLDRLAGVMRTVNGQPEFDKGGITPVKSRTLGELELIKSGAKSRTDRKVDRIETHCENIARKIIANMQANFDIPKIVKITGEAPEEIIQSFGDNYDPISQTIKFTKEDITGEYDVDVKAGSTLPLDKQNRIQILDQVLDKAVMLAQAGQLPPFIIEIVKEMLDGFDMKGLEKAFDDQLNSMEADKIQSGQQAQIEQGKIKAETQKRQAQAEKIKTDSDVSIAKTVAELLGTGQKKDALSGLSQ